MKALVTPAFVRTMTQYNLEMNRRFYEAAARLTDEERRRDRAAFWRSIHGTLSHLLWADRMWMSRFDGWEKPDADLRQSAEAYPDFDRLCDLRTKTDADLCAWAAEATDESLAGDLVWFSAAAQKEMRAARSGVVVHLFNHQTHHRGQVHAMLTATGITTGDTDLMLVVPL